MRQPEGFATVTPYFFVNDADSFVDFLVNGLGGTEVLRSLRPDGHGNIWWISQRLVDEPYRV